jgi:branched-subunit amino acid aminotransferase/4-amino-4-deoxychorismate lyase
MDRLISYNDKIVEAGSTSVTATNGGLLYGLGVFTNLRIYDFEPFAFTYHWERLAANAGRLGIKLPMDSSTAEGLLRALISANRRQEGRARVTLLGNSVGFWRPEGDRDSDLLIFSAPEPPRSIGDLAITISPYRLLSTSVLAGVKQTAMLEHLIAFEEARSRGFGEAVMLNERGEIVSGTAANIFWVEADEIFTPSPSTGCVPGITRRIVHEIASKWNLHVVEGSFPVARLLAAREAFLTSTTREISIVRSFDAKEYSLKAARIARLLERQFRQLVYPKAGQALK